MLQGVGLWAHSLWAYRQDSAFQLAADHVKKKKYKSSPASINFTDPCVTILQYFSEDRLSFPLAKYFMLRWSHFFLGGSHGRHQSLCFSSCGFHLSLLSAAFKKKKKKPSIVNNTRASNQSFCRRYQRSTCSLTPTSRRNWWWGSFCCGQSRLSMQFLGTFRLASLSTVVITLVLLSWACGRSQCAKAGQYNNFTYEYIYIQYILINILLRPVVVMVVRRLISS